MPLPRELAGKGRLSMRLSRRGVPNITLLGRYHYTHASPALRDHAHAGCVEICYLVRGSQNYQLAGTNYRLQGGDVFVTLPGERHGTGNLPEEKGALYWMTVRTADTAGLGRPFLGLSGGHGTTLRRALLGLRCRRFQGSPRMQEHLDAITTLYYQPGTADALAGCTMANHATAFLLEVARCERRASARAGRGALQASSSRYIHEHLDKPLTVPALAQRNGLSVARFKARFQEEAGVGPGEFILRVKVAEAQRRLAESRGTVTDIAFALGFSTSQYFATVFKRFMGMTPRAYRQIAPGRHLHGSDAAA